MKKNILIYGVGTYKNRGVEAIVNSSLNQISQKDNDITIASYDIENNKKKYQDRVKYVNHNRKDILTEEEKKLEKKYLNMEFDANNFESLYQSEVVDAMKESDICISVGGDSYCYPPCDWLYFLDKTSHDLGKKTILWGASLYEKLEDKDLIKNLQNFDVLVIRESLTLNAIKNYVDKDKILFMKDPAFSLKMKKVNLNKWYQNRKYVVLNVSPLTIKKEEAYQSVVELVRYILKDTKYSVCLLPHVTTPSNDDAEILRRIKNEFNKENRVYLEEKDYDCTELKYIISKSIITVAARTHASIAAYSTCVPTLVIGYSVKSKGIAKDLFGSYDDYVIHYDDITKESLINKFEWIDQNKERIRYNLRKQMPGIIEEASHIFDKVMEKIKEQEDSTVCRSNECIGCGVCAESCPKKCITMEENKEGYIVPKIDLEKCIHCNMCRKACPILQKIEKKEYKEECYSIKNKNLEERRKSTSGGLFSILAKQVLKEKGIVYGCEAQGVESVHVRISKESELNRIRGSKYNQSKIRGILKPLKNDLENKKRVLFSGTPCQIGAVKAYLNKDYKNLITVSVICHGVINTKLLKKHIASIEQKTNKKLTEWTFRSKKTNSWSKASVSYKLDNMLYTKDFLSDDLMYLYLKNLILRESCYQCKFKGNNNTSDIVMADYWGIESINPKIYDQHGVSVLIIQSNKGKEFIDSMNIEEYADIEEGKIEDVYKYNPTYLESVKRPNLRSSLLEKIDDYPFDTLKEMIKEKNFVEEHDSLEQEIIKLKEEKEELEKTLEDINNSKRWIMVNKVVNGIHRVMGRR